MSGRCGGGATKSACCTGYAFAGVAWIAGAGGRSSSTVVSAAGRTGLAIGIGPGIGSAENFIGGARCGADSLLSLAGTIRIEDFANSICAAAGAQYAPATSDTTETRMCEGDRRRIAASMLTAQTFGKGAVRST